MRRVILLSLVFIAGCGDQPAAQAPAPSPTTTVPTTTQSVPVALAPLVETTVDGVALVPKTMLDGRVAMLVPAAFTVMDDETRRRKYPSESRPTIVYTNDSGGINVAVRHSNDAMREDQLNAAHRQMDQGLRNQYPSATWFESGIVNVNGRRWLKLDVRTPAIDTDVRNVMLATPVNNRMLLVTFNVTKEREGAWMAPARAIMESLRVTE